MPKHKKNKKLGLELHPNLVLFQNQIDSNQKKKKLEELMNGQIEKCPISISVKNDLEGTSGITNLENLQSKKLINCAGECEPITSLTELTKKYLPNRKTTDFLVWDPKKVDHEFTIMCI